MRGQQILSLKSAPRLEQVGDEHSKHAAAEFGAEFRTDIEAYVSREAVEAVTDWGVLERGPVSAHRYVGFTDPSGGSGDSFSLIITHAEGELGLMDCVREVRPPFSPERLLFKLTATLQAHGTSLKFFFARKKAQELGC